MRKETSLFVEAVIKEDRSVLDFLDAPFTFVNGILAHHYGIPGVSGEEFQRVTLDGEKRGGLLDARRDSHCFVVPDANLASGARKMGSRKPARRRASASAARMFRC